MAASSAMWAQRGGEVEHLALPQFQVRVDRNLHDSVNVVFDRVLGR